MTAGTLLHKVQACLRLGLRRVPQGVLALGVRRDRVSQSLSVAHASRRGLLLTAVTFSNRYCDLDIVVGNFPLFLEQSEISEVDIFTYALGGRFLMKGGGSE